MNKLGSEKSPYLFQHKDNPVWWKPWGIEAFQQARVENKPIFLSIGYSTCHWCHVMAHESFEDQTVAAVLNKNFISIKLDREERPDVDDIYMSAVQAINGHGGWPLSVWLTPEGKPFYGGTYFQKPHFIKLLEKISEIWNSDPGKVLADGAQMAEVLSRAKESKSESESTASLEQTLDRYITLHESAFDPKGGFSHAPKFPPSMSLRVLMRRFAQTKDATAEEMVRVTLDEMLKGGIYDHLVGGFHRYSVDSNWLVPHFEKMLYDQAMLVPAYLEAYQIWRDENYKAVVTETLDYILAEMTVEGGGFYSAQDADSLILGENHKEEGYFATYSYDELKAALNTIELETLEKYFGVQRTGQFEGRNILHLQDHTAKVEVLKIPAIQSAFEKLKTLRAEKPAADTDDKIITAWNGWMIGAFAQSSRVLGDDRYLQAAEKAADFIWLNLWEGQKLSRRFKDGEKRFAALSDDYAAMIYAFIELYQSTFNEKWIAQALALQNVLDENFWSGTAYYRDDASDPLLILRAIEDYDGVRPSANSLSAYNLMRLYHLTYNKNFKMRAESIFQHFSLHLQEYPSSKPFLLLAYDFYQADVLELAIVTTKRPWQIACEIPSVLGFAPHIVTAAQARSGKSVIPLLKDKTGTDELTIYSCREGTCSKPVTSFWDLD